MLRTVQCTSLSGCLLSGHRRRLAVGPGGGLWALMWAVCLHIHQQFATDSNKPLLACISLLGTPHCQAAKDFCCRLWPHCSRKPGRLYQPRRAALTSCCLSLLGNRRICSPSLQGHSVPFINWVVLRWIGFHSQWQVRLLFFFVRMQNTFFFLTQHLEMIIYFITTSALLFSLSPCTHSRDSSCIQLFAKKKDFLALETKVLLW